MNKENTDKLLKRFPHLYRGYYLPKTKTCMCWGFDVGDGWFKIIWKLSLKLEKILNDLRPVFKDTFMVDQVKEKFGTLRFYVNREDDTFNRITNAIGMAEQASGQTCENCGKGGKLRQNFGYLSTLCNKCNKEVLKGV